MILISLIDRYQMVHIIFFDGHDMFLFFSFIFLVVYSKVETTSKEMGKRSVNDSKMNENGSCSNLDLMKLSRTGNYALNYTTSSLPPQPPRGAYMSSILDSHLGGAAKDELPPFVVVGCTHCYMYVMVSKAFPRCPNCLDHLLVLDRFRGNRTKKLKNSQI